MSKKTAVFFVLVIAVTLLLAREGARRGEDRPGTGRVAASPTTQAPAQQQPEEEAGDVIIFTIPPYPPPIESPQPYPYPAPTDEPCANGIWVLPWVCELHTPTPAPVPTYDPNKGQIATKKLAAQVPYPPPGNETADFDITIWTASYIIVRWESQPSGLTSVLCTVSRPGKTETLYLNQFTWPDPGEPWGEWISYYSFHGYLWFASCRGHLNHLPVTDTVTAAGIFQNSPRVYVPMLRK